MSVLVTGSTGLVGSYVYRKLKESGIDVIGLARADADINWDLNSLDFSFVALLPKITHIVHTAALSNVEFCESNPGESYKANVEVTRYLAEAFKNRPGFIFFSTDYVYEGRSGNYLESSPVNPLNVYGRDKLEAENYLLKNIPNSLVLRTTLITGWDPRLKNFSSKLISALRKGLEIRVPTDQEANPTFTDEMSNIVYYCIQHGVSGLYIACGDTDLPRYDFAIKIADKFNLNKELIIPILTSELHQVAKRPLKNSMSNKLIKSKIGYGFRSLDQSINWLRESEPI